MATVVFADLVGSTGIYERLGDAAASGFVTQLTTSLGARFSAHGGRVVKLLGDGLFVLFANEKDALSACVAVQQALFENPVYPRLGEATAVQMQLGMESGDVVEIDGDCFGDAVNSAARLADLAGGAQILTTARVRNALPGALKSLLHSLGPLFLRGKTDATEVFRVQWRSESDSDVTIMSPSFSASVSAALATPIAKSRLSLRSALLHTDAPHADSPSAQSMVLEAPLGRAHIGRTLQSAQELGASQYLLISDSRVSRLHCSITWRGTHWLLADLSSFGTWVYAGAQTTAIALRRTECQLVGTGSISLGCERAEHSPVLHYQVL